MDSIAAFFNYESARAAGVTVSKVFDWAKAARIIRDTKPTRAGAGLQSDWEWTGGDIYRDGAPVPAEQTYTYLSSIWATPELSLDGMDGAITIDCYVMSDATDWNSDTYWPAEALAILNGEQP